MRSILLYITCLGFILSCTKKDTVWTKEDVLDIARSNDPTFEMVVPSYINEYVVNCADYRPICMRGYKIKIRRLEMILLEYENHDLAKKAAISFGGYVKNNWAFDSIQDEPILERFIETHYGAYLPNKL